MKFNVPIDYENPQVAVVVLDMKPNAYNKVLLGEVTKSSYTRVYHSLGDDTTLLS